MKEIIFSESTGGSMNIAGISYDDILIFPNNFYYGSIATDEDLDKHWDISNQRTKKTDFEECLKNGEEFRIWYSDRSPSELAGFYYACYLLSNYKGNIYVMNLREIEDDEYCWTWAGLSSKEIKDVLNKRKLLNNQEQNKIIEEWNILKQENTDYREIDLTKQILKSSYPDELTGLNTYERFALFANKNFFKKTTSAIGDILSKVPLDLDFTLSILISLSKRNVPLIEFDVENPETVSYKESSCRLTKAGADICKRVEDIENAKEREKKDKERLELLQGLQRFYLLRNKCLKILTNSNNKEDAAFKLHNKFNFSFNQAEFILDLPIKYLTHIYEVDTLKELEEIMTKNN